MAAGCSALSSLVFRKNTDSSLSANNPSGYLVIFYLSSFILSFTLYPDIWNFDISYLILILGASVGVLSSILMILTSRALKLGPAGMTFAFQYASAIFPGLILFLFLGKDFGFSLTLTQLSGMALVILGLFIGARNKNDNSRASGWLKYALACFLVQILALTLIQSRCILFDCAKLGGIFTTLTITESQDIWFMPGQFGASLLMQIIIFLQTRNKFQGTEVFYGCLGGVANFSSTCLLLLATKYAHPFEQGILFPCFAVASMVICNIWAKVLYKEKFSMKTNLLCSFGIFMGATG